MDMKNGNTQSSNPEEIVARVLDKKYVIPPALMREVDLFYSHCAVVGGKPVLIAGPSGVGKTLFLKLYYEYYKKAYGKKRKGKICYLNCSHFEGRMARSELFGHIRGAFTGADKEKKGWIEKANNGLLILEEIGDLALDVQAMLLTFIETGTYHRMGDNKPRYSDVFIVGATNKPEELREDFYFRFCPFYIPALHERRQDILYYFHFLCPSILPTLSRWEVMTLLSHHWPGNVREIERVGLLMQRGTYRSEFTNYDLSAPRDLLRLNAISPKESQLFNIKAEYLLSEMKANKIATNKLESLLNSFFIGLDISNTQPAFDSFNEETLNQTSLWDFDSNINVLSNIIPFDMAYVGGLGTYCGLFLQDIKAKVNLLSLDTFSLNTLCDPIFNYHFLGKKERGRLLRSLFPKVFNFLSGIKLEKEYDVVSLILNKKQWIEHVESTYKGNSLIDQLKGMPEKKLDTNMHGKALANYSFEDLEIEYYRDLLFKYHGNHTKAAEFAGINYNTFRSRLRRVGLLDEKPQA